MESRLTSRSLSPKNPFFNVKIPFLWTVNAVVKPPYFKVSQLKLQKSLKSCWPSETESSLQWVICWNNFVRIATHSESYLWNRAKSICKLFSTRACWEMDVMPNVNFTLSCNSKDQLRDLYNYLNQNVITCINTLDGSTLENNLVRF